MMWWMAVAFAVEFGYTPKAAILSYDPPISIVAHGVTDQRFSVKATAFKMVSIGQEIIIEEWWRGDELYGFWPEKFSSRSFCEASMGAMTVGFEHGCIHPIVPFQALERIHPEWDAWFDRVYLRIAYEPDPWK